MITNDRGAVVRTLRAPTRAGINRAFWDFEGEPSTAIERRVPPNPSALVQQGAASADPGGARFSGVT